MKKMLLFLLIVSFILISGCATKVSEVEKIPEETPEVLEEHKRETIPFAFPPGGLGNLCSEEECFSFCQNNRRQCEAYCKGNHKNELCQKLYPTIASPQEKPVLSLPFNEEDEATGILPMGETISHNGEPHAGMDFFWNKEAKIVASVDGEITYIDKRKPGEAHEGVWDIFVRTGKYVVGHTELSAVNPDLHLGKKVQRGEWLGNSWNAGGDGGMIHWEFGYYPEGWQQWQQPQPKPHPDRLCPMTYFDEDSKLRIESIWENTRYEYRNRFPYICSGIYEEYTEGNTEGNTRQIGINPPLEQVQLPVLKNLGVNIEPWNKQTNLAGDLLFDKRVVYDDGRVAGDKVFLDFGSKDKYRINDVGVIEYWFYVPLGTKVRAPIDGTVQIGFFEHTQDWGISMIPKRSQWIVSFEHLVNLNVKEGDVVKAGDVVGEAAPRINKEIAMVEFVVWTGGREGIFKYCPFNFLDDSLKPVYEEKLNRLTKDWEEFIGKDVYRQEDWVAPGCLLHNITER